MEGLVLDVLKLPIEHCKQIKIDNLFVKYQVSYKKEFLIKTCTSI